MSKIQRALLSVSDKIRPLTFARTLVAAGVELLSTGGTAKAIRDAGLPVKTSEHTGFPEMLDGRVKTLHPRVHGGLLFRRDSEDHVRQVEAHGLEPIDLVVVNLYPFAAASKKHGAFSLPLMEEIDIGGPTLIRAAAKNCDAVSVVTDPADYTEVLSELHSGGVVAPALRRELARKAFALTASYDAMISRTLATENLLPDVLTVRLKKTQALRYGENPHQQGALYRLEDAPTTFTQLHGKELSYNNILDAEGSWDLAQEFSQPAAVIFKHVTPCGAATSTTQAAAFKLALACDPVCAFGGILAVNRPLDLETAQAIGDLFLEVIMAPSYAPDALEFLKRKKNLRLLTREGPRAPELQLRSSGHEVLVQQPDHALWDLAQDPPWKVVTTRAPTAEESAALRFAWPVCKHVKSNAIVYASNQQTLGIGAGQMSRVDSSRIAVWKAGEAGLSLRDSVVCSDAFFPFPDGLIAAAEAGATAAIQPGGSMRDAEVIRAADERNIAMVFTGHRHFRH